MSRNNSNQINVPEAKEAMNRFKMECANEVGVNLKQGYNGDLTSRQAGSVGYDKQILCGARGVKGDRLRGLHINTGWRYKIKRKIDT